MRECALADDISLVTIHHIRRKFVVAVTCKTDWPGSMSVFSCLQSFKCVQENSIRLCKLRFPWREHGKWTTGNFKSKCKSFVWFILCMLHCKYLNRIQLLRYFFLKFHFFFLTTFDLIKNCWRQWILIYLVEYLVICCFAFSN